MIRMLAFLAAVTTQPAQLQCVGSCWGNRCYYRLAAQCDFGTCADYPGMRCENVVQDLGAGDWDPRPASREWQTGEPKSEQPVWPQVVVPPRPRHLSQ